MNIFRIDAVYIIHPEAKSSDDDGFYNGSGDKIILDEDLVSQKETELESIWTANTYSRSRASSYPSTGDQLDMMMKDKRDGTTTHQTACELVKSTYPKG